MIMRRTDLTSLSDPSATLMVGVAILAAGRSRRMGNPKALLQLGHEPFISAMVRAAREVTDQLAVISGAHHRQIRRAPGLTGVFVRHNPHHSLGRASSVRVAAQWMQEVATAAGLAGGLILWPVDCPAVSVQTLHSLVSELQRDATTSVVPAHNGHAGHPLLLSPRGIEAAAGLPNDANLREALQSRGVDRRLVPVSDVHVLDNVNTPRDYLQLCATLRAAGGAA